MQLTFTVHQDETLELGHKIAQLILHDCLKALVLIATPLLENGALHLAGKEVA